MTAFTAYQRRGKKVISSGRDLSEALGSMKNPAGGRPAGFLLIGVGCATERWCNGS